MIFPKDFENKIGFTPLRQILIEKCETRLGREEAERMDFVTGFEEIRRRLECVAEMQTLLGSPADMPDERIYDVVPWLSESRKTCGHSPYYESDGTFFRPKRFRDREHTLSLVE